MTDDSETRDETTVEAPEEAVIASETSGSQPDAAPARHHFPVRPRVAVTAALAAVIVLVLLFAPYPVVIDGASRFVPRGTTVDDLAKGGLFAGSRGDLLSVGGGVIRVGGGGDPVVASGSETLGPDAPIRFGASVTSRRGPDVTEDVVTKFVSSEPSTTYIGTGAVETVASSGTVGTARITMGAISRHEIAREVIVEASPRVVLRGVMAGGSKYIALTFDDGPWPGQTQKILDILATKDAKATFFMLGMNVQRHPSLSKLVAASGNEIATHSQTHKLLARATNATSIYEIATGAQTLKRYTGKAPYWYRPAGGSVNPFVYSEAKALGLKLILWNLDTHDYRKPGVAKIVAFVVGNARNGSVVLMHDGGGDRSQTIAALPSIIDALHARGFHFVTLTELYDRPNPPKMPVKP
jgi:peptidoglycan/xylan/chitin deacetylase (PgdA/CDA1 family)